MNPGRTLHFLALLATLWLPVSGAFGCSMGTPPAAGHSSDHHVMWQDSHQSQASAEAHCHWGGMDGQGHCMHGGCTGNGHCGSGVLLSTPLLGAAPPPATNIGSFDSSAPVSGHPDTPFRPPIGQRA